MKASVVAAFVNELEKDAQVPQILGKLWRSGLGRAAVGAVPGAAIGAAADPESAARGAILGGLGGATLGYASPLATAAGRKGAWEAIKRWGGAQKHAITGRGSVPIGPKMKPSEVQALREAERAGITSIPGIAKGLVTSPWQTLKSGWQHAGGAGKLLAAGDVALSAPHILDPKTQEGTAEKALGTLGSAGGYMLASRMPLLGSLAVGSGLGWLTGKAGKGIDVLRGKGKKKEQAEKGQTGKLEEASVTPASALKSWTPSLPSRPTTGYLREQAVGRLAPAVGIE